MGKLELAVVGDTPYIERLAKRIGQNAPEYLEITRCYKKEEMSDFFAVHVPDILLYEKEEALPESRSNHTVEIMLTDTAGSDPKTGFAIFRYQNGAEILRQVFQIYEKAAKENLICWCKTADLSMTVFYAPGGYEMQLPFSMAYAAIFGEKGKTLYINLTEFSGMQAFLGEEDGQNFSDLIYAVRQRKEKFLLCLQGILHQTESFDYIQSPGCPQDLYEIQAEDLSMLLTLLREKTNYEMVVWNCAAMNQAVMRIMEHCGRVFCLVKENTFGTYRKEEFAQFLEKEQAKKIKDKVQFIVPQTGTASFIPGGDIAAQLKDSTFAKQVRMLIS